MDVYELRKPAMHHCANLNLSAYELVPRPENGTLVERWVLVAERMYEHLSMVMVLRKHGYPA